MIESYLCIYWAMKRNDFTVEVFFLFFISDSSMLKNWVKVVFHILIWIILILSVLHLETSGRHFWFPVSSSCVFRNEELWVLVNDQLSGMFSNPRAGMCAPKPVRVRVSVRGCSCCRLQEMRLIVIVRRMRRMNLTATAQRLRHRR